MIPNFFFATLIIKDEKIVDEKLNDWNFLKANKAFDLYRYLNKKEQLLNENNINIHIIKYKCEKIFYYAFGYSLKDKKKRQLL